MYLSQNLKLFPKPIEKKHFPELLQRRHRYEWDWLGSLQEFFAGSVTEVAIDAEPNFANLMVLLAAKAACGIANIAIVSNKAIPFFIQNSCLPRYLYLLPGNILLPSDTSQSNRAPHSFNHDWSFCLDSKVNSCFCWA
jgi:hypothetical protein